MAIIKIEYDSKRKYCEVLNIYGFADFLRVGNSSFILNLYEFQIKHKNLNANNKIIIYFCFIFIVVNNFKVKMKNPKIFYITDHQDFEIKSDNALQHVIFKCSQNIDWYIKVGLVSS